MIQYIVKKEREQPLLDAIIQSNPRTNIYISINNNKLAKKT